MAADQRSHVFSAAHKSSGSHAHKSAINENSQIMMPLHAADPNAAAFYPNAALAVVSTSLQSSPCRMQTIIGTRAPSSVSCGPVVEIGKELSDCSQAPRTPSDGSDLSKSTHSIYARICDGCSSSSSKLRTRNYAAPLQIPVIPGDNELGSTALQGRQVSSIKLKQTHEPANKKLHAANTELESPQKVRSDLSEKAGEEIDQGEEEEGCTTPTSKDHRIPQYGLKVRGALVCPPAPKKKPSTSKRRRLFYSANTIADAGGSVGRTADNFNSHVVAERRAFLTDPPGLHNFPDCIRALFK